MRDGERAIEPEEPTVRLNKRSLWLERGAPTRTTRPQSMARSVSNTPRAAAGKLFNLKAAMLREPTTMILFGILLGTGLLAMARLPPLATGSARAATPAEITPSVPRFPSIPTSILPGTSPTAIALKVAGPPVGGVHRKSGRHVGSSICDPPYRYDSSGIKRILLRCL